MATVSQIVKRALRQLRVLDPNEDISADDMETALVALNSMMALVESNGNSLGWSPVANPADVLPAPPECEEWIAAGLAVRLGPEYAKQVDAVVTAMYEGGLSALRRAVLTAAPLELDVDLPSGRYRGYDPNYIVTGGW